MAEARDRLRQRLANQKLSRSTFRQPAEVVAWLGAVQAQDFPGARWALGLRAQRLTDAGVVRAFDEGAILRTHVLRPTWHFVTPADIRWMIALTGPRIAGNDAFRRRQLEIDAPTLAKSRTILVEALAGRRFLTRAELAAAHERAGIRVTPERLAHLLAHAETEGLICSGPLRGAQVTYALLDERVPPAPALTRDEALARLADRYFTSRAPATLADFSWWSGLPLREAKAAVDMADPALARDLEAAGVERTASAQRRGSLRRDPARSAFLLPNFDEYLVAYRDRTDVLGNGVTPPRDALAHTVIIDGRAAATWRRVRQDGVLAIDLAPRRRLAREEMPLIRRAAERYGAFLGARVSVAGVRPRASRQRT